MAYLNSLLAAVNSVKPSTFDQTALAVFNYQAQQNQVFKAYLDHLGHKGYAEHMDEVVFLPIEFFKYHEVKSGNWKAECVFQSSGTTGMQTSRHFIQDLNEYKQQTIKTFESFYGAINDFALLALLPSYLERDDSGLIAMVDHFISLTSAESSGYYLKNYADLYGQLKQLASGDKKIILWGVTFALLDFAEEFQLDFPELIIIETGGMKGRREEMVRSEVHQILSASFGVERIHSEYGMTELNSQAYSKGNGLFHPSSSLKVFVRDINDPFRFIGFEKTGALNIIDLQNVHTCSFIETKDLGRVFENGDFEVMGRMDNSDIRGCNLMTL